MTRRTIEPTEADSLRARLADVERERDHFFKMSNDWAKKNQTIGNLAEVFRAERDVALAKVRELEQDSAALVRVREDLHRLFRERDAARAESEILKIEVERLKYGRRCNLCGRRALERDSMGVCEPCCAIARPSAPEPGSVEQQEARHKEERKRLRAEAMERHEDTQPRAGEEGENEVP
jgi:hypothetical protein